MLEYEGIDLNKPNKSKECMFCHYWYFLHKNFSYGSYLCDGCYNMTQKSIDFKNIDIVKRNAYRIHFWHTSKHKRKRKREAISLMTNSNLINKKGIL